MNRDRLPQLRDKVSLEVHFYSADVVFKIKREGFENHMYVGGVREKIKGFSQSSERRLNFLIRNSISEWTTLLTLTYPAEYPNDGKVCKSQLRAFTEFLRRQETKYVWVLEFQARGAPHFHLLLSGKIDKDLVAVRWYEIVGTGDEKHLRAGTRIERLRNPEKAPWYMSNYVAKLKQKSVPESFKNVGRFWGACKLPRHRVIRYEGTYREIAAYMRSARRWYQNRSKREWGFKWKWQGMGFCLRDGAKLRFEVMENDV